ncbi:hypothetical protein D6D92_09150 [Moraxella catarrhalis]|nr:hypothetical protein D6D92_09150 [Moraxella catarrhalis]
MAYATGGVGTALTSTVATATGSTTLGTMTSAAFSSLVTQASISLIDNQGNIKQTLKDLGSKQNIKQMTFAIASAGIGSKINKSLGLSNTDITQAGFNDRLIKGIADGTSRGLLESAVYGVDLEEALKQSLTKELVGLGTQNIFKDIIHDIDGDTLARNIAHKLAAGLTGCLSAKAAGNRCEAGSIGAVVGEMWGDYQVDDSNTLTQAQKDKLINQAKLIAGITAVFAGEDVNVAAGVAAEAVQNNALAQQDFNKLYNLYEKIQGRGKNILGQYKMTLAEAEELTNLVILDQVGNQLIDKYRQNPSLLSYSELMALGDIINYYYAGGNSLSHIQSMLTNHTGSTLKPNDYLFNRGTGDEHEKIFWDAATQRNINKQVSDIASLGGDAVFAAPGKVMNVVRIATGSTMIASGIQSVKQGKTGQGSFQIVAGTLMFVPINKISSPAPANNIYLSKPVYKGTLNIGAGLKPIPNAYNISHPNYPMAPNVYAGNADNLAGINSQSQSLIIMQNPYGFNPLNPEIIRVLHPNGKIVITASLNTKGQINNKFANQAIKEAESKGFKVSKKPVQNNGFNQSDGNPIKSESFIEITITKK